MATFHFELVSPEKVAFTGEVDQVDVPGVEGDFGVLAGHAPVIATVRPGIVFVTAGDKKEQFVVLGGLAEVSAMSALLRQGLGFLGRFFDPADHVERLLGQVIVLAGDDGLEAPDGVLQGDDLAILAGEHLGDVEGLR